MLQYEEISLQLGCNQSSLSRILFNSEKKKACQFHPAHYSYDLYSTKIVTHAKFSLIDLNSVSMQSRKRIHSQWG